jgi:N-acyl-D-aspartate/D-glutamate deacylase
MTRASDLVIRGGRVVDGSGGEAFEGDIALADGTIVAIVRGVVTGC